MIISILSSSDAHPVSKFLKKWIEENNQEHEISLVYKKNLLPGGDVLFLISCNDVVALEDRKKYNKTLVIHASDLPQGRGWSPHIWQVINGATDLTVTLLEAEDEVDSGDIWHQLKIKVAKNALWYEINRCIFDAELTLMDFALKNFLKINPYSQSSQISPTYYPKRSPADSEVDPSKSISEQFNLIRTCDPDRFPAFFKLHGCKYKISLEKLDGE